MDDDAAPDDATGRALLHPYVLVFGTSLWGAGLLMPVALARESHRLVEYAALYGTPNLRFSLALSTVGGFLAFVLLLAEVRVVALTSGLSLSIAGLFKDVLTMLASALVLGEVLTVYKVVGLAVCLSGLALYVALEARSGEDSRQ